MKTRITPIMLFAIVALAAAPASPAEDWFVSFQRVQVTPVDRSNTTQLIDAGVIETNGFSELVFSMGGEFKQGAPKSGTIGALLIPDEEVFDFLLRTEGEIVFALEVKFDVAQLGDTPLFVSEQQTAKVAFPRYRVYFYNETGSGANVSLFIYRTR